MTHLSNFLSDYLLRALEDAFINHEPEIQQAILDEIGHLIQEVETWVADRLKTLEANHAVD